VAVLLRVGAQVAADLPAGYEPGLACFLVGAELDVGEVVIVGEAVRGPVGGLGPGSPVPLVCDGHGPARAGDVRLGGDLVAVAVPQVLQGQGPRHVGPVTVDSEALRLKLGGEGGLGLPLGARVARSRAATWPNWLGLSFAAWTSAVSASWSASIIWTTRSAQATVSGVILPGADCEHCGHWRASFEQALGRETRVEEGVD